MCKCFGGFTVILLSNFGLFFFALERVSLIGHDYGRQDLSKPEIPYLVQRLSKKSVFRHSLIHVYSFICSLNKHLLSIRITKVGA